MRLQDADKERPGVEFYVKRTVQAETEDGTVIDQEQTTVEIFHVKLRKEMSLADLEETERLMATFTRLLSVTGKSQDDDEASEESRLAEITRAYRRFADMAFHDPVPRDVLYGVTLERLEEITDFLLGLWELEEMARLTKEKAREKMTPVPSGR